MESAALDADIDAYMKRYRKKRGMEIKKCEIAWPTLLQNDTEEYDFRYDFWPNCYVSRFLTQFQFNFSIPRKNNLIDADRLPGHPFGKSPVIFLE